MASPIFCKVSARWFPTFFLNASSKSFFYFLMCYFIPIEMQR
jgi:hypothetical protein